MSKIIKTATRKKRRAGGKEKIYLNITLDRMERFEVRFELIEKTLNVIDKLQKRFPNLIVKFDVSMH